MRAERDVITVRMYNVGFGDCFLLTLPTTAGPRRMLVDCGAHMAGIATPMAQVVDDVVASVTPEDGPPRIDVVVATHRHYDHTSGFDRPAWRTVEVGEVWMPWTEHPTDPKARALRRAQQRAAAALAARHPAADSAVGWLALNSLSNAGAERTLQKGFAGTPRRRFLPAVRRKARTFTTPLLPGISVHALGPSHDPEVIATLDPPTGKFFPFGTARYAAGDTAGGRPPSLFGPRFRVTPSRYARRYPELAAHASPADLDDRAADDELAAASALEDAINGTSLVLVLEVGDRCLLLPGDAEWGTWREVLADPAWCDLLARTDLYKVSHHGSYNGTPKPFVDTYLPGDATSLMSFRPVARFPSIPRAALVDALGDDHRTLVRSDQLRRAPKGTTREGDLWVEVRLPARLPTSGG